MIKLSNCVFNALCLAFSAVFLVLCMLCSARTAAENERAAEYREEIERLKTENRILYVRAQCEMSLEELERRAIEELGMQHLSSEQIIYIEYIG